MKIGYLFDLPERYTGGAEMTALQFADAAPSGVQIVMIMPHNPIPEDVDMYIIHNCTSAHWGIIDRLQKKPVIKVVHDLWVHGDAILRSWLLANSKKVLLFSPLQREKMVFDIAAPVEYIPAPIPASKFHNAKCTKERGGIIWLGRLWPGKGIQLARQWAIENDTTVDVYGFGPLENEVKPPLIYKGAVDYQAVPGLLAQYARYLFLPTVTETYSRTTAEAWLSGCELVVNQNMGLHYWLENDQAGIVHAEKRFWKAVLS